MEVSFAMQHVYTSTGLRGLHAPLREWIRLNKTIARKWTDADDVPWWYNERALLSVLAGAIWKTGGVAFEEFTQRKLGHQDRKDVGGRVDLWFATKSGREFRAEAKRAEIAITQSAQQLKKLKSLMSDTVDDAGRNPTDGGESTRLAIGFASPYLTKRSSMELRKERIEEFKEICEEIDHDAIAWYFHDLKKLPLSEDDTVHPGIVVWFKVVKRGRRT